MTKLLEYLIKLFPVTRIALPPEVDRSNGPQVWDAYSAAGIDAYDAWARANPAAAAAVRRGEAP